MPELPDWFIKQENSFDQQAQQRVVELYDRGFVNKLVLVTPNTRDYANRIINTFLGEHTWADYERWKSEGMTNEEISMLITIQDL